jgi:broad specificity phosphatase PhoE
MKRLLLIRHGMPHEGHATQPGDPPLDGRGRRHAQRLAGRLRGEGVDRIVCSPQLRAAETAAPLVRLLNLVPEVHDGLAEVDHGTERYRSVATLQSEEPLRWKDFLASPARFFGKDPAAYEANVLRAFDDILRDARGTCVAAFSHGMTIKTLLYAALGVRGGSHSLITIDHCSVSRVAGSQLTDLRIVSINESLCKRPPEEPFAARRSSQAINQETT